MLLALMVSLKYAFGFIPGVEVISFLFIFLGIFLPAIDLIILIASFNFIVLVIYGFGGWWMTYWVLWIVDAFVAKGLSKITKSRFVIGIWGFLAGFLVFFWYFLSDMIFFGFNFALLNAISAIPINLIEGLSTMVCIITIAPTMAKVFKEYSIRFWGSQIEWDFRQIKNQKVNIIIISIAICLSITGIVLLFLYNSWFLELKQYFMHQDTGLIGSGKIGNFKPTS